MRKGYRGSLMLEIPNEQSLASLHSKHLVYVGGKCCQMLIVLRPTGYVQRFHDRFACSGHACLESRTRLHRHIMAYQ